MCREEMNGCKNTSTVNWPSRQEAAWAKVRGLEPSERMGQSMRPAIWSETKKIMCKRGSANRWKNLPGGELVVRNVSWTGRREVLAMKGFEKVVMVMVK